VCYTPVMKIDVMTAARRLPDVQRLAVDTLAAGFDGLVVTEAGRTAYLSCAAAALAAPGLDILTGVAVAFARSPMVNAQCAWELAEASGGRFRLGLGTQVRAHAQRRYGVAFDPPGPRLEEHVRAVRACFAAFRGDAPLDFHGRFHELTFMNPQWSPGRLDVGDPPVDVAGVNPWMLRMAGRVADGLHVHPLGHPGYLREVALPEVAAGAAEAGRSPDDIQVIVPVLTIAGDREDELAWSRSIVRAQLSFYGSTPTYRFILDAAGFPGLNDALRERQRAGDLAGMAELITDEVLAVFAVEASWSELPVALVDRYEGLADRLVLYVPGFAWGRPDGSFERFGAVAGAVRELSGRG
jgi:probable F420-dependent oxidoreductase